MKSSACSLSLLSGSALTAVIFLSHTETLAQCVVADVSVQAAVTGSRKPAQQTNNVDMGSGGGCTGNSSVHTSKQIRVGGTDPVIQERTSRHELSGGSSTGGPTVAVPVDVQVDVYNPAERLRQSR
jgi:hypothetical protein